MVDLAHNILLTLIDMVGRQFIDVLKLGLNFKLFGLRVLAYLLDFGLELVCDFGFETAQVEGVVLLNGELEVLLLTEYFLLGDVRANHLI